MRVQHLQLSHKKTQCVWCRSSHNLLSFIHDGAFCVLGLVPKKMISSTMLASPPLHCLLTVNSESRSMSPLRVSSCASDAKVVFSSFGWSDLPCQGDYLMEASLASSVSAYTSTPSTRASSPPPSVPDKDEDDSTFTPPPSPTSTIPTDLSAYCASHKEKSRFSQRQRPTKVRFADALEVRTYELIIGDHPCCRGGMALQCGWAYGESEMVDMQVHESISRHRRMKELHVGFCARRKRLIEVTGMSGSELLQMEYDLCCRGTGAVSEPSMILHRTPTVALGDCI